MKRNTLYRVKHKPTGLYYQPGYNNLSERGKIYTSPSNIITYSQGLKINLRVCSTNLLKKYQNVFKKVGVVLQYNYQGIPTHWKGCFNPSDFEVEVIKTQIDI